MLEQTLVVAMRRPALFGSFQHVRMHAMMQMARTQKNKATSGHLGMLKVRCCC
jgi:hypothetical protein